MLRLCASDAVSLSFGLFQSFEKFMNMDTRCAQFLAVYVDNLLRHGIRTMSDEEIDETLDKVGRPRLGVCPHMCVTSNGLLWLHRSS